MAASRPGRGIGHCAGLAAETVGAIEKGSSEEMPQSNARLGRDAKAGRTRRRRPSPGGPPNCQPHRVAIIVQLATIWRDFVHELGGRARIIGPPPPPPAVPRN